MRGFTLIELLVVIAILVMLAAAFPVALDRTLPGRRVAVTAQNLVSAVRDAESRSLLRGKPVTLEMSGSGLISGGKVAITFPASTRVALVDADGRALKSIVAYPDGSASAARFEVSERKHARVVVISSNTGRVSLEAGGDAP
jgi:prepilin-type N-terminal cleavage/methylation domain-containing protein